MGLGLLWRCLVSVYIEIEDMILSAMFSFGVENVCHVYMSPRHVCMEDGDNHVAIRDGRKFRAGLISEARASQ